jgi:hypothetical protein
MGLMMDGVQEECKSCILERGIVDGIAVEQLAVRNYF